MKLPRPHSPIIVLCLSVLTFLISDSLLFSSGLYVHYLAPKGKGYSADFIHSIEKMDNYDSKDGVLLLGSSEFRWPINRKLLQSSVSLKINTVMPNNTNEESWYYLLKLGDPHKNKYKLIVIGLPRYQISPEYNIQENLTTAQGLAIPLGWADYLNVINNYPDLNTKFQALKYKLFPSILYSDEIIFQIFKKFRDRSFFNSSARYKRFLEENRGLWRDVILDKQNNLVECKAPQDLQRCKQIQQYQIPLPAEVAEYHTQQNFIFEKMWIQKIIDYYQGTNTKLVFVELPHAPGVNTGSPIAGAPDIRKYLHLNSNSKFLPQSIFEDFSSANFMNDPYHVSPTAVNPDFTKRVSQIVLNNLHN